MNETLKTLLERRSVRGYKEDLVPAEVLDQILEAGEYAPNGNDIGPVLWSTNRDHRICGQ